MNTSSTTVYDLDKVAQKKKPRLCAVLEKQIKILIFLLFFKAALAWSTSQLARPLIMCALPQNDFNRVTARPRRCTALI